MAVIDLDPIHVDLDRVAAITGGREIIAGARERARTLMALWLGIYSSARDRGIDRLAALACDEFFHYHSLHELAPPE